MLAAVTRPSIAVEHTACARHIAMVPAAYVKSLVLRFIIWQQACSADGHLLL
jgi:hypothetical protein